MILVADLVNQVGEIGGFERASAGQQFVKYDADGIQIGPRIGGFAKDLLGRHVVRRAQHLAGLGEGAVALHFNVRDAEIAEFYLVSGKQGDIGRLDVAVDGIVGVNALQRERELPADFDHLVGAQFFARVGFLFEENTFQKLHGDVGAVVPFADVVNLNDVRVRKPAHGAGFLHETLPKCRADALFFVQELNGDVALQRRVERLVNDGHAAPAEFGYDLVAVNVVGHGSCSVNWVFRGRGQTAILYSAVTRPAWR